VTSGLAWAALAAGDTVRGVSTGFSYALMHYAFVRWSMRGIEAPAA
jgi:hypothetical protein